jgi:hypothetical protein
MGKACFALPTTTQVPDRPVDRPTNGGMEKGRMVACPRCGTEMIFSQQYQADVCPNCLAPPGTADHTGTGSRNGRGEGKKAQGRRGLSTVTVITITLAVILAILVVGLVLPIFFCSSVEDSGPQIRRLVVTVVVTSNASVIRSIVFGNTDYHTLDGFWAGGQFVVRVLDYEDNPLDSSTVTIQGCGVHGTVVDDANGYAIFSANESTTFTLPIGTQTGHVTISATRSASGDCNVQIPVLRGDTPGYSSTT